MTGLSGRPPDRIDTSVGRLRALTVDDWPVEQALSRDPDVFRWTLYPAELDDEGARSRAERGVLRAQVGDAQRYVVLADETPIGTAGIFVAEDGTPEIFYALLPDGRGRGAATAAAVALSDWAFSVGARTARLWTIVGNSASEAVAARAGFVQAGDEIHLQRGEPKRMKRWIRARDCPAE